MACSLPVPSARSNIHRRPVAVDLFAGAGGLSLGLEQAGFDVRCAVEHDPVHAGVYAFNHPTSTVLQTDISSSGTDRLAQQIASLAGGDIDLVAGGPPCQGFSIGGRRRPDDDRNRALEHFAELVIALSPTAFVLENVPAMATTKADSGPQTVVEKLAGRLAPAGYAIGEPWVLNACWYGVPQHRRRLFVVGLRDATPLAPPVPSVRWAPRRSGDAPRRGEIGHPDGNGSLPAGPTVRDAISSLPNADQFPQLLQTDAALMGDEHVAYMMDTATVYTRRLMGVEDDPNDRSAPRLWSARWLTSSLRTVHAANVSERFLAVSPGHQEPISRFWRLDPDGLSSTLRAGSSKERGSFSAPRPIHPSHPRVLTVREAARLHGLPDWYRLSPAKWHGFRQVGNAVCPPVARAIGQAVVDRLGLDPVRPQQAINLGADELLRISGGAGIRVRRKRPGELAKHRISAQPL